MYLVQAVQRSTPDQADGMTSFQAQTPSSAVSARPHATRKSVSLSIKPQGRFASSSDLLTEEVLPEQSRHSAL